MTLPITLISFTDSMEKMITTFVHHHPLVGPILLLFLEEMGIPVPIPGDIYISYIGYKVHQGVVPYALGFTLLLVSILVGSSLLYLFSYCYGNTVVTKFGKYIHLNERKLIYIEDKFRKYGALVIIIGRHIPGFRIPITVFSGLSKVKYRTFLISEFISAVIWIVIFMQVGNKLGRKTLALFHNNNSLLFFLLIPVILTIATLIFGKFIPEKKNPKSV